MVKIGNTEINPTKIICLGRNYLDHIQETNAPIPTEPVFFVKTLNTLEPQSTRPTRRMASASPTSASRPSTHTLAIRAGLR